eukprot:72615-Amphidinium_carterae.1
MYPGPCWIATALLLLRGYLAPRQGAVEVEVTCNCTCTTEMDLEETYHEKFPAFSGSWWPERRSNVPEPRTRKKTVLGGLYGVIYERDRYIHQRLLLWPASQDAWVIVTPERDVHCESIVGGDGESAPVRIVELGVRGGSQGKLATVAPLWCYAI